MPQWDYVSLVPLGQQSSDIELAEAGRAEMEAVCNVCNSSTWTEGYMESFDKVVSDYSMVYDYTYSLLQAAYDEELIKRDTLSTRPSNHVLLRLTRAAAMALFTPSLVLGRIFSAKGSLRIQL